MHLAEVSVTTRWPEIPGLEGEDVRRGTIIWPALRISDLERTIRELGAQATVELLGPAREPTATSGRGTVIISDAEFSDLARAYAAMTGRAVSRISVEAPERVENEGGASSVLLTNVMRTPYRILKEVGCLSGSARSKGVGIIHVDPAVTRLAHLVKNMLARVGLMPDLRGRLVLVPEFGQSLRGEAPGETYLFGEFSAHDLRLELGAPHGMLLLQAHSNGLNTKVGAAAWCPIADREGRLLPDRQYVEGERAFACFNGGPCRILESIPPVASDRVPYDLLRAQTVVFQSCDVVLYADAPVQTSRSALPQILATPFTTGVIANCLKINVMGLPGLVHALYASDESASVAELCGRMNDFLRFANGHGDSGDTICHSEPGTYCVVGDPELPLTGPGGTYADVERPASPLGVARVERRSAPIPQCRVSAGDRVVTTDDGRAITVLGYLNPGQGGQPDRADLLIAVDSAGPPAEVEVRVEQPVRDTQRRLARLRSRCEFWEFMLRVISRRIPDVSVGQVYAQLCQEGLRRLADLDVLVHLARARVADSKFQVVNWSVVVGGILRELDASLREVEPLLLACVVKYAEFNSPYTDEIWEPYAVLVRPRARGRHCRCGLWVRDESYVVPGGMRRRRLYCPRCRTIADWEAGCSRTVFEPDVSAIGVGEPLTGVLSGLSAGTSPPLHLGATLSSEPGTECILRLAECTAVGGSADARVLFHYDSRRSPGVQTAHLHTIRDLAWQSHVAAFQLKPGAKLAHPTLQEPEVVPVRESHE